VLFGVLIGQGAEKQKNLGAIPESGKAYRPHLGPSHLRIQYVLGAVAPGVKLLGLTVHLLLKYVMIVEGTFVRVEISNTKVRSNEGLYPHYSNAHILRIFAVIPVTVGNWYLRNLKFCCC